MDYKDEGSYLGGWFLGFLLGLIGLVIGLAIDKPETKRGAIHGFLVSIVLAGVLGLCVFCSVLNTVNNYMHY